MGDLSFTHDGVGNRTSRVLTQGGSSTTDIYGYPTLSNRIANALTNGIETRSFAHDAAGNMTQDLRGGVGGDLYEFTYNHAGRMATAKKNSSTQATYTYTAEGLLAVRAVTGANPVHHVHDLAGNLIAEIDGAAGWTLREYIWRAH